MDFDLIVIGAGAGGCFAAIRVAQLQPGAKICILEAARKPLSKVEISGGGRCNVTHACFDPEALTQYYPRGHKELLGPFYHFQPQDMVRWLNDHGVKVKTEADGRMFPVTDNSATIINCFLSLISKYNIQLKTSTRAVGWERNSDKDGWLVELPNGVKLKSKALLIASGSDNRTWELLKEAGHRIETPVPSLFTFNIKDKQLTTLMGLSKSNVSVSIPKYKIEASGPLLITHWGLSGPAVLKLSAWGARDLYSCNYVFDLEVNWLGEMQKEDVETMIRKLISSNQKKQINNVPVDQIPSRLWKYLCNRAGLRTEINGAEMGKKQIEQLTQTLSADTYRVTGKSTFKEEFVTAGGVDLKDVDLRRFESKLLPGLFLVGEILNIDALTGGFNFQAAWTGAAIAAEAIAETL